MTLDELNTIDQLKDFLSGTLAVAFEVQGDKDAGYCLDSGKLIRNRYLHCARRDRLLVFQI